MFCPVQYIMFFCEVHLLFFSFDFFLALSEQRDLVYVQYSLKFFVPTVSYVPIHLGVDRLSAWPIIGADIKHFTDYRYRPF